MNDKEKGARFIDPEYHELFRLPPGEKLRVKWLNGREKLMECTALDEYHIKLRIRTFHICEFAEICRQIGAVVEPEHPQPNPPYGTYEIYQLKESGAKYLFTSYDYAKDYFNPSDYQRVYAGMLAPHVSLDDLFLLHNRENRPMADSVRSMTVSDVVVTHLYGRDEAFYVDSIGFRSLPEFERPPERKTPERDAR